MTRLATAGDVPALVRLWREMWDFNARLDPRMKATPVAETVMAGLFESHLESERSIICVAQEGATLVGYGLATILENPPVVPHQFYGYISDLSVTAESRRKGVGGLILDGLHAWFLAKGLPYVEVSVAVRNQMSRSFWRKYGFTDFVERLRKELPPWRAS